MHSIAARIESQLTRVEQRFGLWVAAGLVAALLLVVACTYVTPAIYSINHGRHYEYMSVNPFDFARRIKVQSRPLTPVLAWLLFLRGSHYILLPLAVGTALLAVVYGFFRRRDWRPLDAVGMAALLAFSTPLLHVIHFAGYTDTTSYLLLMLMMMAIARPWLVAVLAALALLNHESNLFAFPGLVLFRILHDRGQGRPWVKGATSTGIALALAVLPVAAYRWFLQQHVPAELSNPELNHEYFLASENVTYTLKIIARMLWMGWFMAFKLFWAIPLLAVLACWRSGRRLQAGWFVLVVGGAAGQLVLAHDTSRLLGLAFPAILWGAIVLREQVLGEQGSTKQGSAKQGSANLFTKALWLGIGFNFLVPQYYIGQDIAIPFLPSPVSLVMWLCGVYPWDLWWAG